jgi:hypothetical protein
VQNTKNQILMTKSYTTTSCFSWGIENSICNGLHFHTEAPYSNLYQNNLSLSFLKFFKTSTFHFHISIIKCNFILYILIIRESLHLNLPMTSYRSFGLLHLFGAQLSSGLQHVSLRSSVGMQYVQNSKGLSSCNNEGNPSTIIIVIYALHVYFYREEIVQIPRKI